MNTLGYEFLRTAMDLPVFAVARPARIAPVTRVIAITDGLQIPSQVAPSGRAPLEHVLFALKHEGINLQVLSQALPLIPPSSLLEELRKTPSGAFIRKACYLWEAFTGQTLADLPAIAGAHIDLYDTKRYLTGPGQRNAKWRINFNGLGTLRYCPSVEKTEGILAGIKSDILGRTQVFLEQAGQANADRALAWAYLSETEHSFAIERESPSQNKAEAFVALLHQAHEQRHLTEDYLADLQAATVSNPFDQAVTFRHQQNWLSNGLQRAAGVTYIPPPPGMLADLMEAFMDFANVAPLKIDPLIAASLASFGFVFLHPFMDGNGRLSRFLFHHALCRSGQLPNGLLLPVSIAMKNDEAGYLKALQSFSKPARQLWNVAWIGEDDLQLDFRGDGSIYRYWDATPCVEFGLRMAQRALDVYLREETEFLANYDQVVRRTNERFDVRNSDLAVLARSCLQNGGALSTHRRRQYLYRVPDGLFDALEQIAGEVLGSKMPPDHDEESEGNSLFQIPK
jgi:hypothetical protein